jgi:heptosyltransferase-2
MNVALFLPNWVGDAVMTTPAVRAIRRMHLNGRVVGVMRPAIAAVMEGSGWFDAVIPSDGVIVPAWRLRRERIDLAVLFPNSFRSALTAWLGGCRRRVGFARYGRSPLLSVALKPEPGVSPVLQAYNRLAAAVGCPDAGGRLELFTTAADEAAADRVWASAGFSACVAGVGFETPVGGHTPCRGLKADPGHTNQQPGSISGVVCLNPGAAFGAAKHWPAESFSCLAADLVDRRGCGVLVLCGPAERELASKIAADAKRPGVVALSDIATPSLGLTKALVRRCALLVTTDSGPRHFAHAFNRPVVTLFGPTHIGWTETGHPLAVHLQKKLPCGPCQKRVCPLGHHECMTTLAPEEVLAAAEGLLGRKAAA